MLCRAFSPEVGFSQTGFSVGETVRVKTGVSDPDYPELSLEGWTGVVEQVLVESRITYVVQWEQTEGEKFIDAEDCAVSRVLNWEGVDSTRTPLPAYALEKA